MAQAIDYTAHIEINPEIRFGKPVIKGTRITVYDLLQWLASGSTHKQILEDFPQLTQRDIDACLAYEGKKQVRFNTISIDTLDFKFNRDEANER